MIILHVVEKTDLQAVHYLMCTIGADSMGAITPMAKKLWGRCPQVAPTGILLSFLETVKCSVLL